MIGVVDLGSGAAVVLALHAAVNARLLRRAPPPGPSGTRLVDRTPPPAVSVLVPARDEARRIERCLTALRASTGVDVEILVLDDGSSDSTAAIVARIARHDPRVRLLAGAPPPAGWLGKPHACAQLAAAAAARVLVFVDADVEVAPDAVARTVALLDGGLDLVSPYPRQVAVGIAERLVQPLLQWSWLTFLPLRLAERSRRESLAAANGQLLACRSAAYVAAGGHAAVRGEVVEDVALARAFKRAGLRVTIADGTDLATCRMYEGWGQLRDGYGKSLWAAFGSPRGAAAAMAVLAWLYVAPPVATLARLASREPRAAVLPALGWCAGIAGRAVAARRTGGRVADAPAHLLSIALLTVLTAHSVAAHRRGALEWKGRPVGVRA